MKTYPQSPCPPDFELQRVYDGELNPEVLSHVEECPSCTRTMDELAELDRLAGLLTHSDAQFEHPHHESLRSELLASLPTLPEESETSDEPEKRNIVRIPRSTLIAVAALVFLMLGLELARWMSNAPDSEGPALALESESPIASQGTGVAHETHSATVFTFDGTDMIIMGSSDDEIVRLRDGLLTASVDPLGPDERFRVVVGNAEIEVHGTAFDVVAVDDMLDAVNVIHGIVEVRLDGQEPILLQDGERWRPVVSSAAAAPTSITESVLIPELRQAAAMLAAANPLAVASTSPSQPPGQTPPDIEPARLEPAHELAPSQAPRREAVPRGITPERHVEPELVEAEEPSEPPRAAADPREEAEASFTRGWIALQDGRADDAFVAFSEVRRRAPDHHLVADAEYWRIIAQEARGRRALAMDDAEDYIASYPASRMRGHAALLLGGWRHQSGDVSGAREAFTIAAECGHEPVSSEAQRALEVLAE